MSVPTFQGLHKETVNDIHVLESSSWTAALSVEQSAAARIPGPKLKREALRYIDGGSDGGSDDDDVKYRRKATSLLPLYSAASTVGPCYASAPILVISLHYLVMWLSG
jgi:hypothetical protein